MNSLSSLGSSLFRGTTVFLLREIGTEAWIIRLIFKPSPRSVALRNMAFLSGGYEVSTLHLKGGYCPLLVSLPSVVPQGGLMGVFLATSSSIIN